MFFYVDSELLVKCMLPKSLQTIWVFFGKGFEKKKKKRTLGVVVGKRPENANMESKTY